MNAGVIPITKERLLVFVSNLKGNYIFPKGKVKHKESFCSAAQREAYEEAGIKGVTEPNEFINTKDTLYYVMNVDVIEDDFQESNKRERVFMVPVDAMTCKRVPEYIKQIIKKILEAGNVL